MDDLRTMTVRGHHPCPWILKMIQILDSKFWIPKRNCDVTVLCFLVFPVFALGDGPKNYRIWVKNTKNISMGISIPRYTWLSQYRIRWFILRWKDPTLIVIYLRVALFKISCCLNFLKFRSILNWKLPFLKFSQIFVIFKKRFHFRVR